MKIDKETLIFLSVILGSNVATNAAQLFGYEDPKIQMAAQQQTFAQEQLTICLERLDKCHQECSR
jgi:hypothetical protein